MDTVEVKKAINDLPDDPHYAAASQNGWGVEMSGLEAVDGSPLDHAGIIGLPMTNFTIEAKGIKKARIRNKRGKWLPYKTGFGMNSIEALGDNTDITGIEIVGSKFMVSIHTKGGSWLPSAITSDIEGEVLLTTGAAIDAIWVDKIL